MHEQKHLKQFETYKIEKASFYRDHILNIPCSTNLNVEDINEVVSLLDNDVTPLVSIITPVYNSELFIKETIESVLNQTYVNFEMICVDDCSTDSSGTIIKEYQEKDKRIKYIRLDSNSGAAFSRNIALVKARGRFIAFLDSDDIWDKHKLEIQIKFMKENNIGFSFTSYQMMDVEGKAYERIIKVPEVINYAGLLKNTIIGCLTVVLDKQKIGDFRMPLVRDSQDYATWLQILKEGHVAYGINQNLAKYRKVNGSISSNKFKALRSNWKVYREIERLSIIKTFYVFTFYVLHALKKRLLLR
ncbi:glycosyltransferase [Mycoplasmatota bacterium]|nr:glycosyltransferase [Mycoplasmatota bacterium]